jgi:hypothetical protein
MVGRFVDNRNGVLKHTLRDFLVFLAVQFEQWGGTQ